MLSPLIFLFWYLVYRVLLSTLGIWSEYSALMRCGQIYRLQMGIKMQRRVFKKSNIEENVISPANLLNLWSTPQLRRGADHKITQIN